MDFIETCRRFIEIDSSPNQGSADLARFAKELCESAGMVVQLQEEQQGGLNQANLVARFPQHNSGEEVLLQTHLDTLDPGSFGLWSVTGHNPFNATIFEDKIYGLGAANVKLDFVCKLFALTRLKEKKLQCRPVLAATYGAKAGTIGAIRLFRKKLCQAKKALIGAPTDLSIWNSAKGMASVEISISFSKDEKKFRAEHDLKENSSSQSKIFSTQPEARGPDENSNAILKMLHFLTQLPDGIAVLELDGGVDKTLVPSYASLEFDVVDAFEKPMAGKIKSILSSIERVEKDFINFKDEAFSSPYPKMNIGEIRTQEDHVVMRGICSIPPVVEESVYQRWMDDLRASCEEVGASFQINEYFPPFSTTKESSLVVAAERSLGPIVADKHLDTDPRSSEANTFSRLGLECIMFGPGRMGELARVENEFVRLASLNKATDFYEKFVLEFGA